LPQRSYTRGVQHFPVSSRQAKVGESKKLRCNQKGNSSPEESDVETKN